MAFKGSKFDHITTMPKLYKSSDNAGLDKKKWVFNKYCDGIDKTIMNKEEILR